MTEKSQVGRKEKPREFQVALSNADKRWGDKNRPTWCSDKTCSMIVGWTTSIGWCCGILDNRADLDIVSLCHTLPNEDRQVEDIARILMKPTEALLLSQDLSFTCCHILDGNPLYRVDADRLHKKNLKRAERARKKLGKGKGG